MFEIKNIIQRLIKNKLSISVAESCTGGMLSSRITSISGASKIFNIGLVTYSNLAKIKHLKVSGSIIKRYGAVSEKCCLKMVEGLSKLSKSKINISITGIAGPVRIVSERYRVVSVTSSERRLLHHTFFFGAPLISCGAVERLFSSY